MPEAPAATPVLSTTRTSSPALARCQAVESPWTPAPTTRCLAEAGRGGGTVSGPSMARDIAYDATVLPYVAAAEHRVPWATHPCRDVVATLAFGHGLCGLRPA